MFKKKNKKPSLIKSILKKYKIPFYSSYYLLCSKKKKKDFIIKNYFNKK